MINVKQDVAYVDQMKTIAKQELISAHVLFVHLIAIYINLTIC